MPLLLVAHHEHHPQNRKRRRSPKDDECLDGTGLLPPLPFVGMLDGMTWDLKCIPTFALCKQLLPIVWPAQLKPSVMDMNGSMKAIQTGWWAMVSIRKHFRFD